MSRVTLSMGDVDGTVECFKERKREREIELARRLLSK